MELEKKGFAVEIPFVQYPAFKEDWHKKNPYAVILEELTNIYMGIPSGPGGLQLGKQQLTIMVCWGIVYTEEKNF